MEQSCDLKMIEKPARDLGQRCSLLSNQIKLDLYSTFITIDNATQSTS